MKNLVIIIIALSACCIGKSMAQAPDYSKTVKEKLAPFSAWIGKWKGEGTMQMGQGQAQKTFVDEQINWHLDGTVILINGLGRTIDPSTKKENIVHEALGVLTYNAVENRYTFRSWLRTGMSTDAWFEIVNNNSYQWGFDVPQGKIRYTINLDTTKNTWNEFGEFSMDGKNWLKFFEMNLKKTE